MTWNVLNIKSECKFVKEAQVFLIIQYNIFDNVAMKNHNLMIEIGRRVQYPQMLIDDVELITPLN